MRSDRWTEIVQANTTLEEETQELLIYLSNLRDDEEKSFDISSNIPGKQGSTSDTAARILAITGVVSKIESDEHTDLIPSGPIDELLKIISACTSTIQGLSSHLRSHFTEQTPLSTFNYDNFHGLRSDGQNINCAPQFHQFFDHMNALRAAYLVIAPLVSKSSGNFQAAARALARMIERISKDRDEVQSTLTELKKTSGQMKRIKATTEAASNEVNRLKDNSASEQQTISEYLAEATTRREKIDTIHSAATELESKVAEYDESFQSFQRQLDARDERFTDGTQKLDKLITKFEEQEETIEGIISRSEDMLKSATVAGLAAHFGTIRGELTTELKNARTSFYVGIGLLVVSAVPLLALVLMPIIEMIWPVLAVTPDQTTVTGTQYLGQVTARVIILVPAAWFVRFASRRHSSLFKLREDYAYKYSMAVSVEGFKKQAPDYESEIAAVVFEQLAFNPADNMHASTNEHESPSKLMEMFQRMIAKGMDKLDS